MMRVTGLVVKVDRKTGNKNGRDWAMDIVRVMVKQLAVVEVTRFEGHAVPCPRVGDEVDYLVEVAARGGYLTASIDSLWDDEAPLTAVQPSLSLAE